MLPAFYSPGDQEIYKKGFSFIPRDIYRFGDPNLGTSTTETPTGINTLLSQNINVGGGDGAFNPYNTDMSKIRQDYNAFPSRQAGEIYSKTFNPQSFDPSGQINIAQNLYNKALGDIDAKGLNARTQTFTQTRPSQEVLDFYGEKILDNQEKYRTQGQYVDPYDPNYSSMTEAQKFMDNYPDYYGVPSGVPEQGIKGLMKNYIENSLLGRGLSGVGSFIESILPINQRTIAENEARGAGIFTDEIGRIVTDDYNTAGGIMAGYNLNALTKEGSTALTDRKNTVMNTLENKYGLTKSAVDALRKDPNYTGPAKTLIDRLDLFDEFEDEIKGITSRKKQIYKMKLDKRAADKKRKEEEAAAKAAAKAAEESAKASAALEAQRRGRRPGSGGDGPTTQDTAASQGLSPGDPGAGTGGYSYDSGGRKGFGYGLADGGRVYYMDGGLADLVDIYD